MRARHARLQCAACAGLGRGVRHCCAMGHNRRSRAALGIRHEQGRYRMASRTPLGHAPAAGRRR